MFERTLSKAGLTEYEIKAYLTLLKAGTLGAVELARRSSVPFGKIYDVLYSLELKSFVKVALGKPKQFSPIDPKIALEIWWHKKEEEFNLFRTEIKAAKTTLSQLQTQLATPIISVVRGESNIQPARIAEVLETEKDYCGIISPDVTTGPLAGLDRLLKKKIKAGVSFKWIENTTNKFVREKVKAKLKAGAKIKFGKQTGYNLAIVDGKKVRLELNDPNYGRTSLTIENSNLAKEWKEFFEWKWKSLT